MVQLVFTNETLRGRVYDLVCETTTIGRGNENLFCIRHPSLSRRHCEVLVYGTEVIVRDLGSRNGTFVNGRRLSNQQCQVKSGQIISFGVIEARLQICAPQSEVDDASEYFNVSKYHAELENLQQRQRQSGAEWPLVEAYPDRTIELQTFNESRPPEGLIASSIKVRPTRRRLLIGLILFLLLAVSLFVFGVT